MIVYLSHVRQKLRKVLKVIWQKLRKVLKVIWRKLYPRKNYVRT